MQLAANLCMALRGAKGLFLLDFAMIGIFERREEQYHYLSFAPPASRLGASLRRAPDRLSAALLYSDAAEARTLLLLVSFDDAPSSRANNAR